MSDTRERSVKISLTDEDCDRLIRFCGERGITVDQLLTNFVNDLIGGQGTNGSDERDLADQWFQRCYIGISDSEDTFLQYMLLNGYDPEHYLNVLDNIKDDEYTMERAKEHPEEYDQGELSWLDDEIADWQSELADIRADWHPEYDPDWDEQTQIIKKWVAECDNLKR